jgi:hypothetical protein
MGFYEGDNKVFWRIVEEIGLFLFIEWFLFREIQLFMMFYPNFNCLFIFYE